MRNCCSCDETPCSVLVIDTELLFASVAQRLDVQVLKRTIYFCILHPVLGTLFPASSVYLALKLVCHSWGWFLRPLFSPLGFYFTYGEPSIELKILHTECDDYSIQCSHPPFQRTSFPSITTSRERLAIIQSATSSRTR
jgi:hypothetical protein